MGVEVSKHRLIMPGDIFGRLTVLRKLGVKRRSIYECKCDCGKLASVIGSYLISGDTKSCGCLRVDLARNLNKLHGHSDSPEWRSWYTAIHRCHDTTDSNYHHYGGRSIVVCARWRDSFETFVSDMGLKPDKSYSLDRINNNGNYEPINCRWATAKEQMNNTRRYTLPAAELSILMRKAALLEEYKRVFGPLPI